MGDAKRRGTYEQRKVEASLVSIAYHASLGFDSVFSAPVQALPDGVLGDTELYVTLDDVNDEHARLAGEAIARKAVEGGLSRFATLPSKVLGADVVSKFPLRVVREYRIQENDMRISVSLNGTASVQES
jgi:hypothetical protein